MPPRPAWLADDHRWARYSNEKPPTARSETARDRDRILYSSAFLRLSGITQVVLKGKAQTWPVLYVASGQIDPTALRTMQARWGGNMNYNSNHSTRPYWRYACAARKAERALREMLPYLRGKRAEAVVGLAYRDNINGKASGRSLTAEEAAARQLTVDNFHAVRLVARTAVFPPDSSSEARGCPPKGEAQSSARMTEEQVREIRALVDGGATQAATALQYGLHSSTVSQIVTRRTWAHLA